MARKEVKSEITGSVWKIVKQPGDVADANGTLVEIAVKEGEPVTEGQLLAVLDV